MEKWMHYGLGKGPHLIETHYMATSSNFPFVIVAETW